ncbi:MAG: hypothetical protein ACXV8O_19280 [Methylobacter sp.]
MKNLILAAAILLAAIGSAEAQPTLGEAVNNPIVIRSIMPMVSCEEIIIRGNLFLPKYDKRIWPLITDGCATEIREFQEVCVLVTSYEDDDCQVITDNLLRHHYIDIVNDVIKEDRGL